MFKNFLSIKVKWRYLSLLRQSFILWWNSKGIQEGENLACFFQWRYRTQPSSWTIKTTLFYKTQQKKQQLARLVAHLFPHDPDFHGIKRSGELHWPLDGIRYPPVIPMIFLRETRQHRQHLPLFSCEVAKRTLSTKKNIVATETITHQNQSKMKMIRLPPKKKKRIPLSLSLQAAA